MRRLHDQPYVRSVWETHYVEPLVHFRSLPGQVLPCGPVCDGASYYYLEALPREGGTAVTFIAERRYAEKILQHFGTPPLPVFDPLVRARPVGRTSRNPRAEMVGLNADIYDAIHMLCLASGSPPKNGVTRTLELLRAEPGRQIQRYEIVRFAQAVAQRGDTRPLTQAVRSLVRKEVRLHAFPFIFLRARLRYERLPEGF